MADEAKQVRKLPGAIKVQILVGLFYAVHQTTRNSVLTMFLLDDIKASLATAKTVVHFSFSLNGPLTPFAAILNDSLLGNYRQMMLYAILVYCGGYVLFLTSFRGWFLHSVAGVIIGLICNGLYQSVFLTCLTPLVGDQLNLPEENVHMETFFWWDYWIFNIGALIGNLISPVVRRDLKMCGDENCFPACLGISYASIVCAATLYVVSYKWHVKKPPVNANVVGKCFKAAFHALSNKRKIKEKREHWLDYADDKFSKNFLVDMKKLRMIYMLLPMPIFWAMYSQQETSWVFQARRMNGNIGFYTIPPDQMYSFNPFFCIVLIPIIKYGLYPVLQKKKILVTQLQRICTGAFLYALSYILAGVLVYLVERYDQPIPGAGHCYLRFYNPNSCTIELKLEQLEESRTISPMDFETFYLTTDEKTEPYTLTCGDIKKEGNFDLEAEKNMGAFLKKDGDIVEFEDDVAKSSSGNPLIRVLTNSKKEVEFSIERHESKDFNSSAHESLVEVMPGKYDCYVKTQSESESFGFYQGAVCVVLVQEFEDNKYKFEILEITKHNEIHMLWMVPQYFLAVLGEIFFSISGNEFVYGEAPLSMKSCIQAIWYITKSFGDVFIIIVEAVFPFKQLSYNVFTYVVITFAATGLMIYMSIKYKYVEHHEGEGTDKKD